MIGLRRELDVAQSDYQYRLDKYEDRLCDLYKTGGTDAFLQMLLEPRAASTTSSPVRRWPPSWPTRIGA